MHAMRTPRFLLPAAACALLIAACAASSPDPAPEATERMAVASGVPLATLQRGRAVYLLHCGECHDLMVPDDVSREDWHVVVPGMAWNAAISTTDEKAVLQYLLAAKSGDSE